VTQPAVAPLDVDVAMLPRVLRLVATAADLPAALRLAEKRGGVHIYVPKSADPEHELAILVTLPGMQALCDAYPAEHVMVPKAAAALRDLRNRRLCAARETKSIRDLALDSKLTRRRVQQVLAEEALNADLFPPSRPADLFSQG
jgi:hypothetical protein